jgi:hypothetical protein
MRAEERGKPTSADNGNTFKRASAEPRGLAPRTYCVPAIRPQCVKHAAEGRGVGVEGRGPGDESKGRRGLISRPGFAALKGTDSIARGAGFAKPRVQSVEKSEKP